MVLPLILIDAKGVFLLRILNWYCTQAYIQVKMSGLLTSGQVVRSADIHMHQYHLFFAMVKTKE